MNGKALIGDSASSTTRASGSSAGYCGNSATLGGGIFNCGSTYIGYDINLNDADLYSNRQP